MSEDMLVKWASLIAVTSGWTSGHDESEAESDCIQDLAAALRTEQERVAELEADAKLGRMVREMPVEHHLIHTVYGDWWYGRNVRGEFGATGTTPEAALEAARKESRSENSPNSAQNRA